MWRGLRILTIRGIPIVLHWTFLLYAGFLLISAAADQEHPLAGSIEQGAMLALIFGFVALHELSHSLVAQKFGITVRQIILFPLGGIAMLDQVPEDPRQETMITIAGPLFNLVTAFVLFLFIWLLPGVVFTIGPLTDILFNPMGVIAENTTLFTKLVVASYCVNVIMGIFNLVPAFPMDGGRLLRAWFVRRGTPYARATSKAVAVSKALLVLFVILSLKSGSPWYLLIAVFLYLGATNEERAVQSRHALGHLTAAQLLPQDLLSIEPDTPLGDLVPLLLDSPQRHFPVMTRRELAGVLCHRDLATALRTPAGPALPAGRFMRPPLLVHATDPLSEVSRRLAERGEDVACIMEDGAFAGFAARDALERLARLLDGAAE